MNPLALIANPLARNIAGGLVILVIGYLSGMNGERARGEAAALRTEIATMKADQASATASLASEAAKARSLETLTQQQERELEALRTQLGAQPAADRPAASPAALDRLYQKPR